MRLGDRERAIEVIPTGSTALDVALGVGGLPRAGSWRCTAGVLRQDHLTLHAVARQRAGGAVAFIDAEHALDPDYAKALGVDTDNLICPAGHGEQALEIVTCWSAPVRSTSS